MSNECSMRYAFLPAIVAGAILLSAPAADAADADLFKNKTVAVIVAYPPGGGYDSYGRLFAKHFATHMPGAPTMIVRNMPGASGLVAANHLYNKAPKDGTSVAIFSSSAAFAPMLGNKRAQFKTEKFTWIGVIDQTTSTCATWHTSGIKTFDDLLKQPAVFGAAAATALNSEHPRAFNALLGSKIQVIHGYPGGSSILLAMQRGEVQGQCSLSLSSLLSVRREDFEAGRLIPIVQTGLKKHPAIKDVAHIYDYAKNDEERKIFGILFGRHTLGRPIAAPPELPADRSRVLRAAFDATIADKAFLSDADHQNLPVEPLSGEEAEKLVSELLSTPPEIIAKTLKILEVGKVETVKLKVLEGKLAKVSKRGVEVAGSDGKVLKLRVSSRNSTVTVGGEAAKPSALKAGMDCRLEHFGEGDIAAKVDCR